MGRLRRWAKELRAEVRAVAIAVRDPRTPRVARVIGICTVAYAFCPIDLIPDVIPVLGLLDDLVLVPLGIWLVLRLIPAEVMADSRVRVNQFEPSRETTIVAVLIVAAWVMSLAVATWLVLDLRS